MHGALPGQYQRGGQGQLLHHAAAGPVRGADGQFQQRGAGRQHRPLHHMIGQPRMGLHRPPAGEHHAVIGQLHRSAEQRVPGRIQPGEPDVAGAGDQPARGQYRWCWNG